MLYALNAYGRLQSLFQLTKQDLKKTKQQTFQCPLCHEPLRIRSGQKVIPHFAHFPKSSCEFLKRGETIEHEAGKWALYQWLLRHPYEVRLEHYLKDIQQRPDVWINTGNKRIAVEYQCATISAREVIKRTEAYRRIGVFPLWILGMKHFQRAGPHQLVLNDFIRTFLYYFPHQYQLFFFNTSTHEIILVSNLRGTGSRNVCASIRTYPLNDLTFPHLFSSPPMPSLHSFIHKWEKLWYENRTMYRKRVSSTERNYRQYLYLKGFHFSLIPSACYLPVEGQVQVRVMPYVWQTRMMIDHFIPLPIGASVIFPKVEIAPTVNGHIPSLSIQYLDRLSQLNIVEKIGKDKWVKKEHVLFPKQMKDGFEDDRRMLAKLKNLQRI